MYGLTGTSDRAAEFDVHRTGIEPLGDLMRLPHSMESSESEHLIYFTAEMAMGRLMNRIYGSLYQPDAPPPHRLLALTSELDRQLGQYYCTIPMLPPLAADPVSSDRRRLLGLQYSYARQAIYRPFVVSATSSGSGSGVVMEKRQMCIDACEAYIWGAAEVLGRRSAYLWSVAQRCVVCFVVLLVASVSPQKQQRSVPDLDVLGSLVASRIRPWATPGSSLEALVGMLDALVESRRF